MAPRFSSKSNNTKTWFLMLGIAAVVALDLGFTVLVGSENAPSIALDTPITRSRDIAPTRPLPEPVKPAPQDTAVAADVPAKQIIAPRPRLNSPRPESERVALRRTIAFVQKQDRQIRQPRQRQFEPVTIRYTARPALAFRTYVVTPSENIRYANADVRRPKNDSLVSKFSPLVRKPWHLMKSLVSKLR